MPAPKKSLLIVGIGNILLRDEGIGVHVVKALQAEKLPDTVEVLDGGTSALDLLDSLAQRQKVIFVDSAELSAPAGTIRRFTPDEIMQDTQRMLSLHQFGLMETLQAAQLIDCAPKKVVIFGIQPKDLSSGLTLSPELAVQMPVYTARVLAEAGLTLA